MKQESELVYLGRRVSEERRAAGCSGNRFVRDVHLEFASAYEFRMRLLREDAGLRAVRTAATLPIIKQRELADPSSVGPADIVIEQHVHLVGGT